MATINTIAVLAKDVRSLDTGLFDITGFPTLPAAANADVITLFTAPHAMRLSSAHLRVPNSLGASATLTLRRNRGGAFTQIVATTTAATAQVVSSATFLPIDLLAGDIVELLVGGGALTAGAIEYDIVAQRK